MEGRGLRAYRRDVGEVLVSTVLGEPNTFMRQANGEHNVGNSQLGESSAQEGGARRW